MTDLMSSIEGGRAPVRLVSRPAASSPNLGAVQDLLEHTTVAEQLGQRWQESYRRRLAVVDSVVVFSAVALAQFGRFGLFGKAEDATDVTFSRLTATSLFLAVAWLAALVLVQSRDISLVGTGSEEYRRVVTATTGVFGAVAVVSLVLQQPMSRGFLIIALPVGLVGLLLGRHLLRRNLIKRRARGEFITRVVVLGGIDSVEVLCTHLSRSTPAGYSVAGACIPAFNGELGEHISTAAGLIPVLGDQDSVELALQMTGADALAVAAAEQLGHENMRKLAWRLDSLGVDMIVLPGMIDVAGPRLKLRPIDNLPLFHIARPRHDGPSQYGKRLFDLVFGALALAAVSPVIVAAALAIKIHDGGPVFFRQVRVGRAGRPFRIIKFRTMSVGAENKKAHERAAAAEPEARVFFKSAQDSRITRVGKFLRSTSIDEIPQVLNVLAGSMSIVGPRPLVPGEGESIEHFVQRRALVKPGMTGLWQVSGRSDVSDDERIRLDHSYVDNWSVVQDLVIVWRTVRAVLKRDGAY
ncbi:UDP-glucose:undecaprenyl-phosphate glucose-1-phosphate transferase [Mycolicibacterium vanbaalenii]|uniref:UDP-glucose:undecaprenyl-phosphate glucose-1-phosphate transferase n=1 Tax=Mycolicibacterium vanbaalenii TaxID=110539 RepID=A0A5S9R5L5_MYCVN|nr:sugar transferase [Mycolicibacterium vanbaalenii]CAA0128256.1 UDP-glucose:undecaprenyl-phosphate glucose-1-phosphate transferase [Mycolicibacterium vanbaalenii]